MLESRTARRIEDWQARGLIDAPTARTLLDDIGVNGEGRSFVSVAVWLGILCIAFGAMTFMAANWDAMPRLLRMVALGAGVMVSYIAAGVLHRRGSTNAANAFVVLGCCVFGAAVMFTGQMYHIPGPPSGGVLLWALGTFAAAIATGPTGALGLAVILATLWTIIAMTAGSGGGNPFHIWYLPFWGVLTACAWLMRSLWVSHLCALGALVWVGMSAGIVLMDYNRIAPGLVAVMVCFAAISLAIRSAQGIRVLRGFEREATVYMLFFVFLALAMVFIMVEANLARVSLPAVIPLVALPCAAVALLPAFGAAERLDHIVASAAVVGTVLTVFAVSRGVPHVLEAFTLALSVWSIRMGGRQEWGAVTVLGYIAFASTIVAIYAAALQGLLGTSLFYLGAGVLLLVGALVLPRLFAVDEGAR